MAHHPEPVLMSERDELREFLQAEYQLGTVDSHGTFTLDPERARERLRHWRLAQPHGYALALLASAVAAGAPALEVENRGSEVRFRFEGLTLAPERLLPGLLEGRLSRSERALAMALNSALGEGQPVHVETPGGSATFTGQDTWGPPLPSPRGDTHGVQFVIRRPPPRWSLFARAGQPKEIELLVARGRFAPLEIRLDGQPLPRLQEAPCQLWARYSTAPGLLRGPRPEARLSAQGPSPGPWELELRFGGRSEDFPGGREGGTSRLVLVVDGVSYLAPLPWPIPGLELILAAEVPLDLSWNGPVESPAWSSLLAQVQQVVYSFLEGVEAQKAELSGDFLPYLEPLVGRYCARGDFARAGDLCTWMRERWEATDARGFARARFYYRYALVARKLGKSPLAEALDRISVGEFADAALRSKGSVVSWVGRAAGDPPILLDPERAARLIRLESDESIMGPNDIGLNEKLAHQAGEAERRGEAALALYCWRWLVELAAASRDNVLEWRLLRLGQVLLPLSPTQARQVFRRALIMHVETPGGPPRQLISLLNGLGRAEIALDCHAEACDLLGRCLRVQQEVYGRESPELMENLQLLARCLELTGRAADAELVHRRYRSLGR